MPSQSSAARQPEEEAPSILVVDDDADVRTMVRTLLELDGYEVLEADNGLLGWEMIQALRPPVVLADVQMPGLDGLQLCRLIKSNGLGGTRVIVFTAGMATEDDSKSAGCDGYFLKTDPLPRLREAVRRFAPIA